MVVVVLKSKPDPSVLSSGFIDVRLSPFLTVPASCEDMSLGVDSGVEQLVSLLLFGQIV